MVENIPCREACIYWNTGGDVVIDRASSPDKHRQLRKSGGACWGFWRQCSPEELYYRLLQQVLTLILIEGIDPEKVHAAFKVIPEYRAVLPPDHPDSLGDNENDMVVEVPKFFGKGYSLGIY